MTMHEANLHFVLQLKKIYDAGEATQIADMVMEHVTGKNRVDRLLIDFQHLTDNEITKLEEYISELMTGKPVQYVVNEAWFAGMTFFVDRNVLIPRPETEELVDWVIEKSAKNNLFVLDVGTGSGCIAIALRKKLPHAVVYAIDISDGALAVAQQNALRNDAEIFFLKTDILDEGQWRNLPGFDIIVSNPPYVPEKDKGTMHDNVLNFEPHTALFVPDDDPLIFYKQIARFAEKNLNEGGEIFFEIHQDYGERLMQFFKARGFSKTELKKDLNGNNRFFYLSGK